MPSKRFIYRGRQGTSRHNVNWDAISVESAVEITAAQWQFNGGVFGASGRPVLGDPGHEPNVYVTNVGPHGVTGGEAGGVEFLIHAESAAPIDVVVNISVLGTVESAQIVA
jgi:hypothetical protein